MTWKTIVSFISFIYYSMGIYCLLSTDSNKYNIQTLQTYVVISMIINFIYQVILYKIYLFNINNLVLFCCFIIINFSLIPCGISLISNIIYPDAEGLIIFTIFTIILQVFECFVVRGSSINSSAKSIST